MITLRSLKNSMALFGAMIASSLFAAPSASLTSGSPALLPGGGTLTFTATIEDYDESTTTAGWSVNLPSGWSYVSGTGEPEVKPGASQIDVLEWAYASVPAEPAVFSFTVAYPAGISSTQTISSSALVRNGGPVINLTVSDVALEVAAAPVITNEWNTSGYYNTPFSLLITTTSSLPIMSYNATGLPPGFSIDTSTGIISGTPTATGNYSVTLSATNAAGTTNRSVGIDILMATATVTLTNLTQVYDGTPKVPGATTNPAGLTVGNWIFNGWMPFPPVDAGTYDVSGQIMDPNYGGFAYGTFTISKAPQTITFGGLSSRTFGDSNFSVSATSSAGLPVAYSIVSGPASIAGSTITITGAGTVTVRASQAGTSNYLAATPVEQSFTVAKAVASVSLSNLSFVYNGGARTVTGTSSPGGLPVTVTYNGGSTAPTNAGSYSISAIIDDSNYQGSASGTLVISKASLSVTANDATRNFATSNPAFSATITGFVNSETATVVSGAPAITTTATPSSPSGLYPITPAIGSLSATNYQFGFVDGTLTVELAYHSADTNFDWKLNLLEVTRVIDLYNTTNGTTRTGAYHSQVGTEDGFAPGTGAITVYHMSDTDFNGQIELSELMRVIELYNTIESNVRTGAYHIDLDTEDFFAPGVY